MNTEIGKKKKPENHLIKALHNPQTGEIIRPDRAATPDSFERQFGKMRSVWKEPYFPFDPTDVAEIRAYILSEYGRGCYRVYKWGGHPPHEEYLPTQWLFGRDEEGNVLWSR